MIKRFLLIFCISVLPGLAAFNAGTHWRLSTTGLDSNGGGFDSTVTSPGTDESTGSGTAVTLIIGGTTTQATMSPVISATTHGPGNFINVTAGSGCTVQRIEELSQSSGTGTFDKSLGTAASTCTGTLGGPLLTPSQANTLVVSGNTVDAKTGTYTVTTGVSVGTNSIWRGYTTTPGETCVKATMPLITTATDSVDGVLKMNGIFDFEVNCMSFSNTAATRGVGIVPINGHVTSHPIYIIDTKWDGFLMAINGDNAGAHYDWADVYITRSEIANSTSSGGSNAQISLNSTRLWLVDSLVRDGAYVGIIGLSQMLCHDSTIARNGNAGLLATSAAITGESYGCNWVGNGADGVHIGSSATPTSAFWITENSIYYGNTGYGLDQAATGNFFVSMFAHSGYTNAYGANTTAATTAGVGSASDITLTADPFTSSAGNDFTLNSASGGGALLRKAGYPGVSPAGTGKRDVGAIQTTDSGGQVGYGSVH